MFLLGAIIILGVVILLYKTGINSGSIIGAVIGLIIGSSLGIAGGGTAINGTFIFAGLGFIIGALVSKPSTKKKISNPNSTKQFSTDPMYNLSPEVEKLINQEKEFELAQLLVYLEMKGDIDLARKTMRIIRSINPDLGHRVKKIRDNLKVKNNL